MEANIFLAKLAKIIEETGATELSFTVADSSGYDATLSNIPGIFTVEDGKLLIGGSDNDERPDGIGGKNDLLKGDI